MSEKQEKEDSNAGSKNEDNGRMEELEAQIRTDLKTLKEDISETLEESRTSMKELVKAIEASEIPEISGKKVYSFLDYFGTLPYLEQAQINLKKSNFIKSIAPFLKKVDLKTIFYYISILKVLNIDISESFIGQAFKTMKKQTHEKIFTSPDNQNPDPINIFYGLSTVLELRQYEKPDFIDIKKITQYIQEELNHFDPRELQINYYLLNSYNILNKANKPIDLNKQNKLEKLLDLNLPALPEYDLIRDLYQYLSCIKLLDPQFSFEDIREECYTLLKDTIQEREIGQLTITESARSLLIIDLLKFKNENIELINPLIDRVKNATTFFGTDSEVKDFSWEDDILAYLVELRMLFFSLIVNLQYGSVM